MKIWNVDDVTWAVLEERWKKNIGIKNYKEIGVNKKFRQCTLDLKSEVYRKINPVDGRRIHAVCWHGHYQWMHSLFDLAPEAKIVTGWMGKIVYDGREDFIKKAYRTQFINVGSQMNPVPAGDSCNGDHP